MFVGYQYDGFVYALDLNRTTSTYRLVGRYKTGRAETATCTSTAAPASSTSGKHGQRQLSGSRRTRFLSGRRGPAPAPAGRYAGPRNGNLEGFTVAPAAATNDAGGCIVTDDDDLNQEAVMWYRQFQPADDVDATTCPTRGTLAFRVRHPDRRLRRRRWRRIFPTRRKIRAGTDPTNETSRLVQYAPRDDAVQLVLTWQSATAARTKFQATADLAAVSPTWVAAAIRLAPRPASSPSTFRPSPARLLCIAVEP
jgi:hypothetical protein